MKIRNQSDDNVKAFHLTEHPAVQQLYIYGGLLVIYASINGFPIKTLAKLGRIGALWLVVGSAPQTQSVRRFSCKLSWCLWLCCHQRLTASLVTCHLISYAGGLVAVSALLMVAKQHQKWSWVLTDYEVRAKHMRDMAPVLPCMHLCPARNISYMLHWTYCSCIADYCLMCFVHAAKCRLRYHEQVLRLHAWSFDCMLELHWV